MPVVNPGIRRLLASAIQRLFNGASFSAPLTHSAIPTRAASGTTATFTRATTATVRDNEGVLRTAIAGEARFEGARRVRNLVSGSSEDLTNAAWSNYTGVPLSVTVSASDLPPGAAQVTTIVTNGVFQGRIQAAKLTIGTTYVASYYAKGAVGGETVWVSDGVGTGGFPAVTNAWVRYTKVFVAANTALTVGVASTGSTVKFSEIQLEDITGRTDQTTPSEYVSVGVASSPYYHGSMVDGVKCFATDINGAAIPSTTLLGYQAEGARTNLCLQSNAFDNASWTKAAVSVVADQYTAPDGATTADKVLVSAGNAQHYIYLTPLSITAATYSVSFYCKYINHRWIAIDLVDSVGHLYASFDLLNGVTGAVSGGVTSSIESVGNGFYRISWTAARALRADASVYLIFNNSNTASFETWNAVGTEAVGVWGAQVELGSFASSYIPTTTIAVARNADVLTYSSSGNAVVTAGWIYCDAMVPTNNTAPQIQIDDGSNNNRVMFDDGGSSNGGTRFVVQSGGVIQANFTNFSSSANSVQKRCVTWATNYAQSAQGGSLGTGDTSVTVPVSFTQIGVGGANGSAVAPCNIKNLRIGQRQLSASEQGAIVA